MPSKVSSGTGPPAGLDAAAAQLYAAPPEQFVERRTALARAARSAGDPATARAVAALRRPTVGAWLVNLLVRTRRTHVEELLALGEALREAERSLTGPALRELSARRNDVVAALVAEARTLAEQADVRVAEGAVDEVHSTLHAALALPEVAEAVRGGRLVKPAAYAGFGSLGAADGAPPGPAIAAVPAHRQPGREPGRQLGRQGRREPADQRVVREADRRLARAQAERVRLTAQAEQVELARGELAERVEQLREQVNHLERRLAEVALEARSVARRRDEAEREVTRAQEDLRKVLGER